MVLPAQDGLEVLALRVKRGPSCCPLSPRPFLLELESMRWSSRGGETSVLSPHFVRHAHECGWRRLGRSAPGDSSGRQQGGVQMTEVGKVAARMGRRVLMSLPAVVLIAGTSAL